jgi:hypothetical protein
MSWEVRDGRRYYYRAARRDGQVVKTYVGKGTEAELAARLDARARRERERVAGALKAERTRVGPAERVTGDFEAAFERIMSASMHAAGYHRHRSGPWRKRRNHERTTSIE